MVAYLFGDQLIITLLAFGAVLYASARLVTQSIPVAGLVILTFVSAMFLSDLGVFLSTDFVGGVAALAVLVLFAQYVFRLSLVQSAAVMAVAWVAGAALVYNVF